MAPSPHRPSLRLAAVLAAVALAAVAGCGQGPQRPDVLLLTIDTLRGDRWGCLGDADARTPHLDRLARGGTLACEGRAPAPITLPSHTSMMTGLPPAVHGVRDNGIFALPTDRGTTLAEAMHRAGWTTAAFVSAYPLGERFGLDRGFDRYDSFFGGAPTEVSGMRQRNAGRTVGRLEAWLDGRKGGPPPDDAALFLWVHFFDPHAEYVPPEPWASLFAGDPYRGEVAFADEQAGRLLEDLARRGERERLVVVAADHGEGLDEHGESTHGALVHLSTIRVPVLVRRPAYAPRVLTAPLALERIPATILAAVGLDPLLNPGAAPRLEDPPTPVHAETLYPYYNFGWAGLRAREENGWRLIAGPVDRLYRIAADPGEVRDLARQHPDLVVALRHGLESEWADRRSRAFAVERRPLSEADTEALRALGYVAGAGPAGTDPDAPFLAEGDAEGLLGLVDEINRGLTRLGGGDAEGAVAILRGVVLQDPRNRFAQQYLGEAAMQAGRLEESRGAFRTALRLGPNPYPVYRDLAWVHAALGDTAAARETLLEAIARNPDSADARARLAMMLVGEGRLEEAAEMLRAAAELRPRQVDVWSGLGAVSMELGRRDEAADCFRRVLELDDEGPLADDARRRLQELRASGRPGS